MEKQNILNKSTINNEKTLLSLSLEKIEEYIQLLQDFQNKYEVEAKFVEADLAQKKIDQITKIKNKKKLLNRKNQQIEEKDDNCPSSSLFNIVLFIGFNINVFISS